MRALLTLVAGGPGRVANTAAFAVTILFVLAGHSHEMLITVWFGFLWFGAFAVAFAVLAMIGASTGVDDGKAGAPAPREADRG